MSTFNTFMHKPKVRHLAWPARIESPLLLFEMVYSHHETRLCVAKKFWLENKSWCGLDLQVDLTPEFWEVKLTNSIRIRCVNVATFFKIVEWNIRNHVFVLSVTQREKTVNTGIVIKLIDIHSSHNHKPWWKLYSNHGCIENMLQNHSSILQDVYACIGEHSFETFRA
jgi:hypothetical protein